MVLVAANKFTHGILRIIIAKLLLILYHCRANSRQIQHSHLPHIAFVSWHATCNSLFIENSQQCFNYIWYSKQCKQMYRATYVLYILYVASYMIFITSSFITYTFMPIRRQSISSVAGAIIRANGVMTVVLTTSISIVTF